MPTTSPTANAGDPISLLDEARRARRSPASVEELGQVVRRETLQRHDEDAGVVRHDQPDTAGRKTLEYLAEEIVVIFNGRTPNSETRDFVRGDCSKQVSSVLIPTKPVPVGDKPAEEVLIARPGQFTTRGAGWEVQELPTGLINAAAELVEDQREAPEAVEVDKDAETA